MYLRFWTSKNLLVLQFRSANLLFVRICNARGTHVTRDARAQLTGTSRCTWLTHVRACNRACARVYVRG